MKSTITLEQFHELTKSLVGLPISKINEGYFNTGVFHLGKLQKRNFKHGKSVLEGAASMMLEWAGALKNPTPLPSPVAARLRRK